MRYLEIPICVEKAGCIGDPKNRPILQSYLLDSSENLRHSKSRKAILISPGGAYSFKSNREAEPVAMRFLAQGMQAFVVQYSVAPAKFPCALVELAAAVAYVREHAREWDIDPDQIFCCGFSAGGHLTASLGTLHNRPFLKDILWGKLGIKEESYRPNGMILAYPVISSGTHTHKESMENLVGKEPSRELLELVSLEQQVTEETVPVFLWHTQEDEGVGVENSLLFAAALRKHGVPFEMHIYENGEHGLALCDEVTEDRPSQVQPDAAGWVDLAVRWLRRR